MYMIGIVGSGPKSEVPNLKQFENIIDLWIGVDRGSIDILKANLPLDYAIGDFDSVNKEEVALLKAKTKKFLQYPTDKDQTDLDLAIAKAINLKPKAIYLFGVTGGRLDHELINIQQLLLITRNEIEGYIIDKNNIIKLVLPGLHKVNNNKQYPYISFIPFTEKVTNLTLEGFHYPLTKETIEWGSTLCLSNELVSNNGTFFFDDGILLVIKSRD